MDAVSLGLVVVVLFAMDWRLALVALCIAPVWVIFMRYFAPRIKAVSHRMQENARGPFLAKSTNGSPAPPPSSLSGARSTRYASSRNQSGHLYERTIDKVKLAARQEMLIQLLTRMRADDRDLGRRADDHAGHHDARYAGGVFHLPWVFCICRWSALRSFQL